MNVGELIEKLSQLDPNTVVVYWPDVHESSGYSVAAEIELVFIEQPRSSYVSDIAYSHKPKDGFIAAVALV